MKYMEKEGFIRAVQFLHKEEIKAKWLSVCHHVHTKHSGFGGLFPACLHPEVDDSSHKKKWFKYRKSSKSVFNCVTL